MNKIFSIYKQLSIYYRYFLWRGVYVYLFENIGKKSFIASPNYIFNHKYMIIGDSFRANRNFRIEAHDSYQGERFTPKIIIGNNVSFETDCHIACINKIQIGNNVLFASGVFITDHFHGRTDSLKDLSTPPVQRLLYSKGPVLIKDNVWIGQNVSIMPNVSIGHNAIVGANSVVTKDIPDNAVAAGNPAKILKIII
jgi:acetyltransferase-like isoleucine patch superfamily enzyme